MDTSIRDLLDFVRIQYFFFKLAFRLSCNQFCWVRLGPPWRMLNLSMMGAPFILHLISVSSSAYFSLVW